MKIINLHVENVKRLKAVDVTPGSSPVVVVGGANGAGKSSLLDSIMYALAGNASLPEKPVRRGQEKAEITLDLGELLVSKCITAEGSVTLKVKTKAGVPQKTPQAILDQLCGNLTFDPTEFARMEPRKQLDLLKSLVGLDFADLDDQKAALTEERLLIGRGVKQLEGQVAGMPYDDRAPRAPSDVALIAQALEDARKTNAQIDFHKGKYGAAKIGADNTKARIAEAEAQIVRLRDIQKQHEDEMARQIDLAEGIEPADEKALREAMVGAQAVNATIAANKAKDDAVVRLKNQRKVYDNITAHIQKVEEEKAAKLAAVKFPVPTLTFDETGVLVAGVPFQQASAAEQLRVSLAMGMALNPKLRVMIVRDGSLLDETSMALIAEMAKANEYQCWIERVGEGDESAIIIEDGHVKE